MSRDINMPLALDEIRVPDGRRSVNAALVSRLADSIEEIGLKHPITVRKERGGEGYILVAGLHRIEAFRKLGKEHIPAVISTMNNVEARLWEIAENLHRADLTVQERSDQVAEWVKLTNERERREVSSQVATKPHGGRPESGERAAARELGMDKDAVHRAVKIAGLSDEAKQVAEDLGLDDNQSALLEAARQPTPEAQVVALRTRTRPVSPAPEPMNDIESKEKWMTAGMNWWNRGSKEWRNDFLQRVDVDGGIPEFLRRA